MKNEKWAKFITVDKIYSLTTIIFEFRTLTVWT